ncbi:MAG: ATP phosphoribosyltransferase regulatory subunit [Ruminococcus sp.]|nr:ATP phosphoribosyltransferase regulatory subunit [Ruminococcus sp.]
MKKNYMITPEGAKDYLFKECASCRQVTERVEKVFKSHEFKQVITPGIEFYDLFTMDSCSIDQEYMFKTVDNKGRLLAVRPDSTLPIARLVSTRLKNKILPVRLYYNQSVFRNIPSLSGRNNEIMQMGVELLGATGKRADLEILTTAIQSLSSVTDNFRIELGHSEFFNALSNQLDVSDAEKEEIRFTIESKNYSALNSILDNIPDTQAVNAIRKLPRLFGDAEVFDKAAEIFEGTEAMNALDYLKDIYTELSKLDINKNLSIDLGLVQRNDYYDGIVFCGYVQGSGDSVISGGRYDSLLEKFDAPMGAAGFAINVNELAKIYIDDEKFDYTEQPDVLVFAENGNEIKALEYTNNLIKSGVKAQFCVLDTIEQAREYAQKRGIEKIDII